MEKNICVIAGSLEMGLRFLQDQALDFVEYRPAEGKAVIRGEMGEHHRIRVITRFEQTKGLVFEEIWRGYGHTENLYRATLPHLRAVAVRECTIAVRRGMGKRR